MKKIAIGVDVGGSHVSSAAFNWESEKFLDKTFAENDLDNHAQSDVIIDSWGKTIAESIRLAGVENIAGVGFAMPGPFDYENGIPRFTGENNKYENIYGLNVPEALRAYLKLPADFPVRFINDATAFAIGEDWAGKAKGSTRSLSITLGTGFGSAFLKDSLPVTTGADVPDQGCIWHLPFESGIADDYFSTRGLIARYKDATGKTVTGAKAVAEAAAHEKEAQLIFDDFGQKLIDLLQPWLQKFGVEVLVIGGNIANAFHLFQPTMNAALQKSGLSLRVELSELKENAAIIGSARLAEPDFWKRVAPCLATM
ncbi:ROK family protein [Sunxiuqinia dokdonensis]|uniref:ROK family transcriptional regulator n=1 Tax=Sunxiuqinia dokdonensis TaxID=1409788 RepID=A0A0L8V3F5_9BACT|nr:ROK family protein [Sunxiuqinia dokdonensis]KOH42903.1 ROK family transcriptional regulator [Sunxiuqinia dokdonensis]